MVNLIQRPGCGAHGHDKLLRGASRGVFSVLGAVDYAIAVGFLDALVEVYPTVQASLAIVPVLLASVSVRPEPTAGVALAEAVEGEIGTGATVEGEVFVNARPVKEGQAQSD